MPKSGDIVGEICGDWGRWQLRTTLLIFICKIPSSWFMACIIFTAPYALEGEYACIVAERADLNFTIAESPLVHPAIRDGNRTIYDQCRVFKNFEQRLSNKVDFGFINGSLQSVRYDSIADEENDDVESCDTFVHFSPYHSVVTTFDTVCDKKINLAWTQFWHLFGVLCGGVVATLLLDYISPRRLMLIGMITQIICGSITGYADGAIEIHSFMRAVSSFCCAQMFTAGQMIFSDITGGNYRKSVLCLYEMFWGFGVLLLALIGYLLKDWQHIYLAISLPTTFYIVLWAYIPDSPRWLLKNSCADEAKEILLMAARINKRKHMVPVNLDDRLLKKTVELSEEPKPLGWWSLWVGPKAALTMIALYLAWPIYFINYNGMLLNIRAFGRDYLYWNTVFAGISEIIGVIVAWYFVVRTERKWMWSGWFNILAAFVSWIGLLIPDTLPEPVRIFLAMTTAMIPKIATTCTQSVLIASTAELVPPLKQRICVFSCVTWARIWFLWAPFVGVITDIHYLAPSIAYAQMGLLGGVATVLIDQWHFVKKKDPESSIGKEAYKTNNNNDAIQTVKSANNGINVTRF